MKKNYYINQLFKFLMKPGSKNQPIKPSSSNKPVTSNTKEHIKQITNKLVDKSIVNFF